MIPVVVMVDDVLSTPAENGSFMAGENGTPDPWVTNLKTSYLRRSSAALVERARRSIMQAWCRQTGD